MQDLSFCPKCGTALQPGFQFCASCGFALSTIKQADPGDMTPVTPSQQMTSQEKVSPVPNKPVAAATQTPLFSPQVHLAIIILIFAGIGAWIWSMESSKHKKAADSIAVLPDQPGNTTTQDNKDIPTLTIPSTYLKAEDFAGVWRAYEANNSEENDIRIGNPEDDLFIEVTNGNFVMYPRNEKGKEYSAVFTCNEVAGNSITCKGKSRADDSSFTIQLEMQSSKNEMTITIIPDEATEKMILKTRRL